MERKTFLSSVAGTAAVVGALGATAASATQVSSNRNLMLMRDIVRVIHDDLAQDLSDYGGNKDRAMADLAAAANDLNLALQYSATH